MNKGRVFYTSEGLYTYEQAEQYGEVRFITSKDVYNIRNSDHNRDLARQIETTLADFDPEKDFVTPVGSPYVSGMVFMVLGRRFKKINVLRWSGRDQKYHHIEFELGA